MKFTKSKDNVPRADVSLKVRLSVYDIAIYLMFRWRLICPIRDSSTSELVHERILEVFIVDKLRSYTKNGLMSLVRAEIVEHGGRPYYEIGDYWTEASKHFLIERLAEIYKVK